MVRPVPTALRRLGEVVHFRDGPHVSGVGEFREI